MLMSSVVGFPPPPRQTNYMGAILLDLPTARSLMKGFALCDLAVRRDQSPLVTAAVVAYRKSPKCQPRQPLGPHF